MPSQRLQEEKWCSKESIGTSTTPPGSIYRSSSSFPACPSELLSYCPAAFGFSPLGLYTQQMYVFYHVCLYPFTLQIICTNEKGARVFSHRMRASRCDKGLLYYFSNWGPFVWTSANKCINQSQCCAEPPPPQVSPATTATATMAEELIIWASQCQTFDKQDANYCGNDQQS